VKKFIATILCFIYVVASSGATINFHYCMGKFIGWDVNSSAPETCNNCGMHKEAKKGCCNDKRTMLQLKKDQLASGVNIIPDNSFIYILYQYPSLITSSLSVKYDVAQSIHSPPLIQNAPSYIRNCVFLI